MNFNKLNSSDSSSNKEMLIFMFFLSAFKKENLALINSFSFLRELRISGKDFVYSPFYLSENEISSPSFEHFINFSLFHEFFTDDFDLTEEGVIFFNKLKNDFPLLYASLDKYDPKSDFFLILSDSCFAAPYDFINCSVCDFTLCSSPSKIKRFLYSNTFLTKNPYREL